MTFCKTPNSAEGGGWCKQVDSTRLILSGRLPFRASSLRRGPPLSRVSCVEMARSCFCHFAGEGNANQVPPCVVQAQPCLGPQPLWLRQWWGGCLLNTAALICANSAGSTQLKALLPFLILTSHLWGRGRAAQGNWPWAPAWLPQLPVVPLLRQFGLRFST